MRYRTGAVASDIVGNCWQDSVKLCKGDGDVHTWYLLTQKRKCRVCAAGKPNVPVGTHNMA